MSFSLFKKDSLLLPAFSRPYADELFSSWLAQLSYDHGLTLPDFCKITWSVPVWHNRDIDRFVDDEIIHQLALKTNAGVEEVRNTTLMSYQYKLFEKLSLAPPDKWPLMKKGFYNGKMGLMFCPKCLSTTNSAIYLKKYWRLALSFLCVECGNYLEECCPHCKEQISFYDKVINKPESGSSCEFIITCHHCNQRITECDAIPAPNQLVCLQRELYQIQEEGFNKQALYPIYYFKMLYQIASLLLISETKLNRQWRNRLIPFIEYIFEHHVQSEFIPYGSEKRIQYLPVHQRTIILQMAHWLLGNWPKRFLQLANLFGLQSRDILSDFNDAPFWFWEPVYFDLVPPPFKQTDLEMPFGLKSIFEKPRSLKLIREKKSQVKRKYLGWW